MPPDRFTHEQLSEKARSLHPGMSQPGDIGPAAHGSIRPPAGMGGTPQPSRPDPHVHPSGGPHVTGNPPRPDTLGTAVGPSFDRDALFGPERITPTEIAANADKYGANSTKAWGGKP